MEVSGQRNFHNGKNNFHAETEKCRIQRAVVTLARRDGGGVPGKLSFFIHLYCEQLSGDVFCSC